MPALPAAGMPFRTRTGAMVVARSPKPREALAEVKRELDVLLGGISA